MLKRITKKYILPHKENDFRPHLLRVGGVAFLLIVIVGLFLAGNAYQIVLRTSNFIADVLPAVLVDLANSDRTNVALGTLKVNPKLEEAARLKAEDMAAKGYFAHVSPDGLEPWHWFVEAGYPFVYAGENLAVNFEDSAAVNEAWMQSPGHRANILNEHFTEIGIATARGMYQGRPTIFVVQEFGSPAKPIPAKILPNLLPTSTEPVVPKPKPVVAQNLVPVASSTVLGVDNKQEFIAVKDVDAIPAPASMVAAAETVEQSSLPERVLSSPSELFGGAYGIVLAVLVIMFFGVLFIRHEMRKYHIVLIILLILLTIAFFVFYRSNVQSKVQVQGVAPAFHS